MPISQQRMMTVIAAGKDYQRALDTILRSIAGATERAEGKAPEIVWEELYNLNLLANPLGLLHEPMKSPAILLAEDRHFKSNAGRNNYARKWQAQQRGAPTETPEFISLRQPAKRQPARQQYSTPDIDPRITAEDLARFNAQAEEDKKRDAAFSLDFALAPAAPLDDSIMAEIEAEAEREIARQQHAARSEELARASKDGKGD